MPLAGLDDIVEPGGGVALGSGWSAVQLSEGRPARIVATTATLICGDAARASQIVIVCVEPVDPSTSPAMTISYGGMVLAHVTVYGSQLVRAVVPQTAADCRITVAASGGAPDGPALQVTSIRLYRSFGDIVLDRDRLGLGANWHPLEIFGGRAFRWASREVELHLLGGFDGRSLEFDLETGPGAADGPLTLRLVAEDGREISVRDVRGSQRVTFDLGETSAPAKLRLRAQGGGSTTAGDERVLDYRVFDIYPAR